MALRFAVYYAVLGPLKRHSTHLKLKLGALFVNLFQISWETTQDLKIMAFAPLKSSDMLALYK